MESVLRKQADKEFRELPNGLADGFGEVARKRALKEFFVGGLWPQQQLRKWFGDIFDEHDIGPPRVNEQKGEDAPLIRLICLLVWADGLAGDYTDSRLEDTP